MTKLYRIRDRDGDIVRTRQANGYYDERVSAERALKQMRARFHPPHVIEETEVNWVVSP